MLELVVFNSRMLPRLRFSLGEGELSREEVMAVKRSLVPVLRLEKRSSYIVDEVRDC
jgi:hypothetical protein